MAVLSQHSSYNSIHPKWKNPIEPVFRHLRRHWFLSRSSVTVCAMTWSPVDCPVLIAPSCCTRLTNCGYPSLLINTGCNLHSSLAACFSHDLLLEGPAIPFAYWQQKLPCCSISECAFSSSHF